MSAFTEDELEYLRGERLLARLATVETRSVMGAPRS